MGSAFHESLIRVVRSLCDGRYLAPSWLLAGGKHAQFGTVSAAR